MPLGDFVEDVMEYSVHPPQSIKVAAPLDSTDTQFPFYRLNDYGQAKTPDAAGYVKDNELMT